MRCSQFGEFMRILRVKNRETMVDTARLFNVKIPFVSAVEKGKKNVPSDWREIIIEHYNLNDEEKKQLEDAIVLSKTQTKINTIEATLPQRKALLCFERSFKKLDNETANKIIMLLEEDNK